LFMGGAKDHSIGAAPVAAPSLTPPILSDNILLGVPAEVR